MAAMLNLTKVRLLYMHGNELTSGLTIWGVMVFNTTFNNIMAVSFTGGGNLSTRRKPTTCHKSLTNFVT